MGEIKEIKQVSRPEAQRRQKQPPKQERPTIAVFDTYGEKVVPIDPYDVMPDIAHGKAVESFIKCKCPAVDIKRYGKLIPTASQDENGNIFNESFKLLADSINKGEKIDAVNLSIGNEIEIKSLAKITELPLTRENLIEYKEKVREWFKKNNSKKGKQINEQFTSIEQITAKGVPVFVSAGNDGKKSVSLISFAKGVTTVGALEADGKSKTSYSVDNALVNKWEIGDYDINKVKNSNGEEGYDINGDNKPEILAKDTSSIKSFSSLLTFFLLDEVNGTSFSTPTATGKFLRNKYGCDCDK